ncbi:MAG: hypothetical protein RSF84_09805 [Ruthenibacterium sp.]
MPRLTQKISAATYTTNATADAINKLGRLEDLCDTLPQKQAEISAELAVLRAAGKEKSVQFRELLTQKLTNSLLISTLQAYQLL